jgi:hypothetical protein
VSEGPFLVTGQGNESLGRTASGSIAAAVFGLAPTNNHSEQQIRHCVIDRKITQGTRGELGQRYHERMWTAIATRKKQKRNFFSFLLESIEAIQIHQPAPTLHSA